MGVFILISDSVKPHILRPLHYIAMRHDVAPVTQTSVTNRRTAINIMRIHQIH